MCEIDARTTLNLNLNFYNQEKMLLPVYSKLTSDYYLNHAEEIYYSSKWIIFFPGSHRDKSHLQGLEHPFEFEPEKVK